MNALPVIQVQQLQVQQYGKTILKDLNFIVQKGEHLFITGAAGSGKTTLGKAIAGKIFYRGTITIHKHPTTQNTSIVLVEDIHRWKNLTNLSNFYYQQRFNSCDATDSITVEADLRQHAQQMGMPNTETLYLKYCQSFNLLHRLQTPLIQLSNGEQKKLQIIKALMQQPDVLIADNIMTGLDVAAQKNLLKILEQLTESGITLIYIGSGNQLPACITHILTLEENGNYSYIKKTHYKIPITNGSPLPQLFTTNKSFTKEVILSEPIIEITNTTIQYGSKKNIG